MAYTASVLARADGAWTGADLDLSDIDDLDGLADLLRESSGDAPVAVLFLDEDDEYVALVRTQGDDELRVFVSDRRALEGPGVAGRLLAETTVPEDVVDPEDDVEDEGGRPELEPAGEPGLLDDLGVDAETLLELCNAEGMLPADVAFAVCERMGCAEVLEQVRGV